jgi:hypothetical protein
MGRRRGPVTGGRSKLRHSKPRSSKTQRACRDGAQHAASYEAGGGGTIRRLSFGALQIGHKGRRGSVVVVY